MKMKTTSSHATNIEETRSRTTDAPNTTNRNARSSHVSISSNKRPSVNKGGANSAKVNQGMFRRAVPQMPRALAFICFVLNLILPGTGIHTHYKKKKEKKRQYVDLYWIDIDY
jgi:hypothetical protein